MLEFIAGIATGIVTLTVLSFALASRTDRKAREQMRRFAEMQEAIFDVQDAVADLTIPHHGEGTRLILADLRASRDRAAAAYFAAI